MLVTVTARWLTQGHEHLLFSSCILYVADTLLDVKEDIKMKMVEIGARKPRDKEHSCTHTLSRVAAVGLAMEYGCRAGCVLSSSILPA